MSTTADTLSISEPHGVAPLTLADVQEVVTRRWLVAVVCAVVVAALVILVTRSITPLYEAKAVLTIDYGTRTLEFQRDNDAQRLEISGLNTVRDQLIAVPVLRAVIDSQKLMQQPAYARVADPVSLLRDRVKATTSKDSLSILLSLRDEDPERATAALVALIEAYQGTLAASKNDKSQNAVLFLRDQAASELVKLELARKAETDFINANNIVSANLETNPLSQRLASLTVQLVQIDGQIAASTSTWRLLDSLEKLSAEERLNGLLTIEDIARQPAVADQVRANAALAAQVAVLGSKYGPNHIRLVEAKNAQADHQQLLAVTVMNAAAVIRRNQQSATEQTNILRSLIAEQELKLQEYRTRLLALGSLSEITESRNRLYQVILGRLNEMEVSSALDEKRTKVIDPPNAGLKPVNIKRGLFLGLAAVAALVAAVGGALAVETFDVRLQGAKQIQDLVRAPLLGAIPMTRTLGPLGRHGDPESPHDTAEAFRHLRAAVRLARRNAKGCERLAILSCTSGEGKSTVSARLSISLAAMGARVLLIDADLRKPTQDDQMGEHTERGLSLLLADEKGIAPIPSSRPNLDYLGVGIIPPNPGELLLSPRLSEALAEYSSAYDYIIIDTPPLSLVADSLAIAEHMDGLILVVRDGHTDKDMLRLTLSRVAPVADRLLGFVLNGDRSKASSYYGKTYQHGYGAKGPGSEVPAQPVAISSPAAEPSQPSPKVETVAASSAPVGDEPAPLVTPWNDKLPPTSASTDSASRLQG